MKNYHFLNLSPYFGFLRKSSVLTLISENSLDKSFDKFSSLSSSGLYPDKAMKKIRTIKRIMIENNLKIILKNLFILYLPLLLAFTNTVEADNKGYKKCIEKSSKKYNIPIIMLEMIVNKLEKGKKGMKNINKNGSYDMGIMQINSIHLPQLKKFNIDETELINNNCVNIDVGAWILAKEIRKNNSYALGLASYHSYTQKHQLKYLMKSLKEIEK